MIRLQDLTPDVYYEHSRDFQFIGRLFDLVLNSVKTEADLIFNLPLSTNSPDELLELLTYTFGLKLKPNKYTHEQLRAICSIAPLLSRSKGSFKAISALCAAILRAAGTYGSYLIEVYEHKLVISLPVVPQQKELLYDLLAQIVPAGMTFEIKRAVLLSDNAKQDQFIVLESVTSTLESTDLEGYSLCTGDVPFGASVLKNTEPQSAYLGTVSTATLTPVTIVNKTNMEA
jgi:hypothetical protein